MSNIVHRLTGFDPQTERITCQWDVPDAVAGFARAVALIRGEPIGDYPLNDIQVGAIAELIGARPKTGPHYFLTTYARSS